MRPQTRFRVAPFAAALAVLACPAFAGGFDAELRAGPQTFDEVVTLTVPVPAASEPTAESTESAEHAEPVVSTTPFGDTLATDRLDAMRGGDGNVTTTTNRADVRGNVGGNTASNVVGGGNLVADGSFGNAAGISTVIQNSGSNVLIQNSTIVNVQFVPTP